MRLVALAVVAVFGALWLYAWGHVRQATSSFGPSGAFAVVEGSRVHYTSSGQGPAVVLLHGNPGSARDFDRVALTLAGDYHVIAVDRPGHGYSERPPGDATPSRQAALLRGTLQQVGITRPLLVGHSWGGALALVYALDHPDDIAGLVLVGTRAVVQPGGRDWLYRIVRTPVLGRLVEWTILVPAGRRFVEQGLSRAYAPEKVPSGELAAAQALWLRPSQMDATVWDTANLQDALAIYSQRYGELRVPTLIVAGDRDDLLAESVALHESIPDAELKVLPGVGHMVIKTHPDVVAESVRALASRIQTVPDGRFAGDSGGCDHDAAAVGCRRGRKRTMLSQ